MEWIHQPVEHNTTQSANLPIEHLMNEQDIEMFMKAFDDFMQQSETAIEEQKHREEARLFYERKAAEHEVTVDYYMQEFL